MENLEIRLMINRYGLKHKEVAKALGIRSDYFSHLMSKPLSGYQRERIIAAVDTLRERKGQ